MLKDDKVDLVAQDKDMKSNQKQAEKLEIDLNFLLYLTPGYIYWKDLNSTYWGCNQTFENLISPKKISEDIGLSEYEMPWASIKPETAAHNVAADQRVIRTGEMIVTEEDLGIKKPNGLSIILRSEKRPLRNKKGDIIGVLGVSVDISDQKEAERLRLQEKEKLITLAHTVAHDISSPLTALSMLMNSCDELQERKRSVIKTATASILDIANNLLSTYRNEEQRATSDIEQRQSLLISDLIIQLLSEKKVQYSNHAVKFETIITNEAQFAFAQMQSSQFRRSMSNLINNAVDAIEHKDNGVVTIQLSADAESIFVSIQDNGKGMSLGMKEKMLSRQSHTEGKQHGHGLGLRQVWDTLDANQADMNVHSVPGEGTTIQLSIPRINAPTWIAQQIQLVLNSSIVILDDDDSIHGAWDTRFAKYLKLYPTLTVHHFKQGKEALDFFHMLTAMEKNRVVFLSDYELLRQKKNGLQIIEESGIKNTTLVTSYYADSVIRNKTIQSGVKILPKLMASVVPIDVDAILI